MPDSILVVEYEPRYIERVRQALSGHSQPNFARDGEEALAQLGAAPARLIVLSSIIPKISTAELIRRVRAMAHHQHTPILITVSGYNGKSPKADAVKLGATDILPKPYSEGEFLNKVKQLIESPAAVSRPAPTIQTPKISPESVAAAEPTVQVQKVSPAEIAKASRLSSEDLLGDLVDETKKKTVSKPRSSPDLDKLLETTLSGLQTPKKPSSPKLEAKKASEDLDKLLETTLSGLDVSRTKPTVEKPVPEVPPAPPPAAPPPPAEQPTARIPEITEQMPVLTAAELEEERRRSQPAPEPPAPPPMPTATPESVAPPVAAAYESVPLSSPVFSEAEEEEVDDEADDGIRFGQYILQEKIATGGMAEVWKARMRGVEGFQKTVAIKKILPHMSDNEEFFAMFVDEAKLAAQLSHNNIIHIYELGKQDDSYYIAMEFVDGEDLKSIIKRGRETGQPMSIELALFVTSKIAAALDYAHRKRGFDEKELGLVHRDVSPQNVLISYEGDIKLCDFGIAKAASKASHTMAGALKGKLQYMSPEQAWGRSIDRRSDIFALAAVLFEMLTGKKLFTGDSELSVLEQVREARVIAPSTVNEEVPARVDAIVLKALAKNPDERYQSAGEMVRDIDEVLYSFRPTPTSADLAIHMHRLYVETPSTVPAMPVVEEPLAAPEPEPEAFSPEPEAFSPEPVALVPEPPLPTLEEPVPPLVIEQVPPTIEPEAPAAPPPVVEGEEKKFPVVPVAIAAVVLIAAIGGGAFLMLGKKSSETTSTAQASPPPVTAPSPVPAPDTAEGLETDTTTTDLVDPEAATDTALDETLIDQEVQRRLDVERARLEAQRQQQLRRAEEESKPPPQPAKQPERTRQETAAPPPPPTETAKEAETPEPPPAPTQPSPTPAPQPQKPAEKVVKEGDLVAVGTPGLVAPSLVKFSKPDYPPVAKLQRVEGIVIIQALISETGDVLEAKVLRGVSADVGINEAALDAIKRSTFKPATKDGVRVKSYYTRTIPFRL